jgi:hypothetical protein
MSSRIWARADDQSDPKDYEKDFNLLKITLPISLFVLFVWANIPFIYRELGNDIPDRYIDEPLLWFARYSRNPLVLMICWPYRLYRIITRLTRRFWRRRDLRKRRKRAAEQWPADHGQPNPDPFEAALSLENGDSESEPRQYSGFTTFTMAASRSGTPTPHQVSVKEDLTTQQSSRNHPTRINGDDASFEEIELEDLNISKPPAALHPKRRLSVASSTDVVVGDLVDENARPQLRRYFRSSLPIPSSGMPTPHQTPEREDLTTQQSTRHPLTRMNTDNTYFEEIELQTMSGSRPAPSFASSTAAVVDGDFANRNPRPRSRRSSGSSLPASRSDMPSPYRIGVREVLSGSRPPSAPTVLRQKSVITFAVLAWDLYVLDPLNFLGLSRLFPLVAMNKYRKFWGRSCFPVDCMCFKEEALQFNS